MTGSRFSVLSPASGAGTPPDPSIPQYDTQSIYGDVEIPGVMRQIDPGFPLAVSDPLNHIRTAGYNPGANLGDWPEASANFRYITPSEGGQAGTVGERSGYSSGLAKLDRNAHHFTGRAVRFVFPNPSKDDGPASSGVSSYGSKLAAGVDMQSRQWPSLTEIAQALVHGH